MRPTRTNRDPRHPRVCRFRPLGTARVGTVHVRVVLFGAVLQVMALSGMLPLGGSIVLSTAHASQDLVAPSDQVRGFLDSGDSQDWVRGLTLLQQATQQGGGAPPWTRELLIEYLDTRALEDPLRTRAILADPVMRSPSPGEGVLIYLLGGEASYENFGVEIESAFSQIASKRERRDSLSQLLGGEVSGTLFERLFPILAQFEPNRLVDLAIERLAASTPPLEPAIRRALASFVGYDLVSATEWREWWDVHKKDAVLRLIVERERRRADERTSRMWELANRHLFEGAPGGYQRFLLDSLQTTQPPSVRTSALQELERFVPRLTGAIGEGALTPQQQQELLSPLLGRLVEMVDTEATTLRDRDPVRTQVRALTALGTFAMFKNEPRVVELLSRLIEKLPGTDFSGDSRDARLGQLAVRIAGVLQAPVGRALDRALAALLPAGGGDAWDTVPPKPLAYLLQSLKQVGASAETVTQLERIYENRPDARENALWVLVQAGVPSDDASAQTALKLFGRALSEEGSSDSLWTLAINGIGRLGSADGIPPLRNAILGPDLTRERKSAALNSLRSIGGEKALETMVDLLLQIPEGDDLGVEIVERAGDLCALDPTLQALESFLIDAEDRPRPWLRVAVECSKFDPLLAPARQPADLRASRPEAYPRFEKIHAEYWTIRAEAALEKEDLARIAEALDAVAVGVRAVVGALGANGDAHPRSSARLALESVALSSGQRGKLAAQLVRRDLESLWTTLGQLLDEEAELLGPEQHPEIVLACGHVLWVIEAVNRYGPLDDFDGFIAAFGRFAERHPLDEGELSKLAELEARGSTPEGGGVTDPPPSDPPPPDPTGGAPPPGGGK